MSLTRLVDESLEKYGEYAALAFVVLKPGEAATDDDVMAFCATRLARFKCPKHVRFVDSLPKSPIGKILKKELRRQL